MIRRLTLIGAVGCVLLGEAPRLAEWWLPSLRRGSAAAATTPARREVWARAELAPPADAYTGADIGAALSQCKPGCALRLLAETYSGVAIDVGPGFGDGQLAILGAGKGRTVLEMRTDNPDHVIDIQPGAPNGIEIGGLTIDGRKDLQRPPRSRSGVTVMAGINVADPSARNVNGLHLHDLELKNLVYSGISVRNADHFVIEGNDLSDMGCDQRFTPCGTRLSPNPWAQEPDIAPTAVGTKAVGFAILVSSDTHDGVVRNNTATRTTKYAIGVYTNGELCGSAGESRNITLDGNVVRDSAGGIVLNGGCYSTIRRNEVYGSGRLNAPCPGGCTAYFGFASGSDNEGNVFESNIARENMGSGFHLGGDGPGGKLTIANNQSIDNCLLGDGYGYYDYAVVCPAGSRGPYAGVVFSNNSSTHTRATKCQWAVNFGSRSEILMDGGSYVAGTEGGVRLDDGSGIEMRNTTIIGSDSRVGIWVGKGFRRGRIWPSVALSGRFAKRYVNESPSQPTLHVSIDLADGARLGPPGQPQSSPQR